MLRGFLRAGAYVGACLASLTAVGPAAARVVGHGTPASCTSHAVIAAVRAGGVIRFACGPRPVTIRMTATARVRNTVGRVVLDGGGLVSLSGAGRRRILYMDTCDPTQVWTTSHCQDQASPQLVVENLAFVNGNSTGQGYDGGGGGAIFDRGGRLRIVHASFIGNRCERTGTRTSAAVPCARCPSTTAGPSGSAGATSPTTCCSNGGALSSIGVSWTVRNSRFAGNRAIGVGANPRRRGTPGGGSGGAIYNDGNRMTLSIVDCTFTDNHAREGGGAVFFVSNDRTGTLAIRDSTLIDNPNLGFHTPACRASTSSVRVGRTIVRSTLR